MVAWEKHLIQILSSSDTNDFLISGDPGRWPQPVLETLEYVPRCCPFLGCIQHTLQTLAPLEVWRTKPETCKKILSNWPWKNSWQLGIYGYVLARFNKMEWTETPTQKYLFKIEYLMGLNTSGEPFLHDP